MTRSHVEQDGTGASGVAGGVPERDEEFEPRKSPRSSRRWKVACINWSHANAPHAVAYFAGASGRCDRYFTTWSEAIAWADEMARKFK